MYKFIKIGTVFLANKYQVINIYIYTRMVLHTGFFQSIYYTYVCIVFLQRNPPKEKNPSIHVNGSTAHLKGTPCKGGVAGQPRRYFCLGTPGRKKEAESSSNHPVSGMLASGKVYNVYILYMNQYILRSDMKYALS